MTQEEKRIKLAEAQGWEKMGGPPYGEWWTHPNYGNGPLPDYFNDLNAIVSAVREKVVEKVEQDHYAETLVSLLNTAYNGRFRFIGASTFDQVTAEAQFHAEALGVALGLWKEGE